MHPEQQSAAKDRKYRKKIWDIVSSVYWSEYGLKMIMLQRLAILWDMTNFHRELGKERQAAEQEFQKADLLGRQLRQMESGLEAAQNSAVQAS
jgi:hypothetical protein